MVVYRIEAVTNDENKYRPCCHGCGCGGYEGACKYPCGVAHSGKKLCRHGQERLQTLSAGNVVTHPC